MSKFLDTRGNASLGIGICGRCSAKFPIGQLYADPNSPGLRVCLADLDDYDPYRLAPRAADKINLLFVRMDVNIDIPEQFNLMLVDGVNFLVLTDGYTVF